MSGYKIRVTIEDCWGGVVAEAVAPIDDTVREFVQPLKLSDGAMPFLDTSALVVRRVKNGRDQYAQVITPKIAQLLLDTMSAKDLFNGYTKAELKHASKPTTKETK